MPVIGVLHSASPEISADRLRVFRQGLKAAGYVEGENVAIEYRWAENQLGRLPELAIDLVRRRVGVIAALGSNLSALAAKEAARRSRLSSSCPRTRSGLDWSPASRGQVAISPGSIF